MKAYALKRGAYRVTVINADSLLGAWELATGALAEDAAKRQKDMYPESEYALEPLGNVFGG
jgi:hypothetical protein